MNLSKVSDPRSQNRWLKAGALATVNGPVVTSDLRQALENLRKIDKEIAKGRKTRSLGVGKGSVSLAVLRKAAEARIVNLRAAN